MSISGSDTPNPAFEEERRLRRMQQLIDCACVGLASGVLTRQGALDLMADTRVRALKLFPGCEDQYDLIYAPRLRRMARERGGIDI